MTEPAAPAASTPTAPSQPAQPVRPAQPVQPMQPPVMWAPPPPRPLFSGPFWRKAAHPARPAVLVGAGGVGVLAGLALLAPIGVQWLVVVGAVLAVVLQAAPRPFGRPLGRPERPVLALIVGLVAVGAVWSSGFTFTLCLLAAAGLGAMATVGARSWPALLLTPILLPLNALRALPWGVRGLRAVRVSSSAASIVRGLVVAVVLAWVCLALLASADSAFAGLLDAMPTDWTPATLMDRVLVGALVGALTLALAFNAVAPPRGHRLRVRRRTRPVVEWLLPLVAVDVILAVFVAVQAAVLFGAYPDELVHGNATPAERARQGFGQLVVLTLVVIALLGWAARICDEESARHRRLLAAGGGALLVLVLIVGASALRRLWLYEQAFGWTVLRLRVGVFELWLGVVVLLTGAAWLARRTALVPRIVTVSAGAALLVLGLAGPDALVASWNVDRFQRTGRIDTYYLGTLSDDAVPALSRLPEPQRSCVLADRDASAPWYAANLARLRARRVLDSLEDPLQHPSGSTRSRGC